MCYSARVRQSLNDLIRKFGATVDWEGFELLFRRRLEDGTIKISRALEDNFAEPNNPIAEQTRAHIEAYRRKQATTWETDLFKQKTRLVNAERSLQQKETKKAREDLRIATDKIDNYRERLSDLKRTESRPNDSDLPGVLRTS
jgi:DNA-binding Lrp family transcriptional regulator